MRERERTRRRTFHEREIGRVKMPGTRKQQSQQSGGSGMILENDVDGRGKENDDEMRNVTKTTKRGGRSSKRGGKTASAK